MDTNELSLEEFWENTKQYVKNNKLKTVVAVTIIIALLIGLFISDDWQQKRYATLRSGYHHMMEQEYDEAITDFQTYLNVNSKIYWKFVEMANDEFYSRDVVNEAIDICNEKLIKGEDEIN